MRLWKVNNITRLFIRRGVRINRKLAITDIVVYLYEIDFEYLPYVKYASAEV